MRTVVLMGVKQTLTEYTVDEVRRLAEILRRYADRYGELAKKLDENKIGAIAVPNQKSLQDGLDKLRRHIAEAEISYNEILDMNSGVFSGSDANQAAEKTELYITPVGKNSPVPTPTRKPDSKSNSSTKKKAE